MLPAVKRFRPRERNRQATRALHTGSAAWRQIRMAVLAREPLCRACAAEGRAVPARDVDHIDGDAHNNDPSNLQPLCIRHHSRKTATENGGFGRTTAAAAQARNPDEPHRPSADHRPSHGAG